MRKTLPFLTVTILLLGLVSSVFVSQTHATFFIAQGTHIAFHAQADLIMGVDFTFGVDTFTYGNGSINVGDTWLNSTCDMTLTAYFENGWFNYTVSGAGTQQIFNGTKPSQVWINGVSMTENTGWTYSSGVTTVGLATSSVSIYFESETEPIILSNLINFYFLNGQSLAFYSSVYPSTFNIQVTSGVWDGQNGTIRYNDTDPSGVLTFVANESCILQMDLVNGYVSANGSSWESSITSSLSSGDTFNIAWYYNISANLWIPIRPAMGVAGFAIMFIMPLLIIRKAREHDWKWVLMPGFVSLVLGYCLIVGWLWP